MKHWLLHASFLAALWLAAPAGGASAHPLDPALLDVRETAAGALTVAWHVPVGGSLTASLRPVLPSRCIERSPPEVIEGEQRLTTRWRVDCGGASMVGEHVRVEGLRERGTDALLRISLADGRVVQAVLRGERPDFVIPAGVTTSSVFADYLRLGVEHIFTGVDHLLFVLGLLLLVQNRSRLFWTVTAFTLGHSITLALATLGIVSFPSRVVEALIAVTIFAVAVELVRRDAGESSWSLRAPWAVAFSFGLLHGFGFAGALAEVGLPHHDIPAALLAFNVGIEAGQLVFIVAVLGMRTMLRALPVRWPAAAAQAPAYLIGSLAVYWVIERTWGALAM